MASSLDSFKAEYTELLLRFLWRQWSALGVAGYARSDDPWAIDPEALLLFSTEIARHDPRLFDEMLDWLAQFAGRLSLQRLNRMQKEYALANPAVLAAIAERLSARTEHHKWSALAKRIDQPTGEPQSLFPDAPALSETDPHFAKWGLLRPPFRKRSLSQAPRPDQPATFLFKLRSLFGLQSRAEIMAWLLANESGHPAEIARQTGYFKRSVQTVLNELEASGHARSLRSGREKHFALRRPEWRFLAPWAKGTEPVFPTWIHWPPILQTLHRVHQFLARPDLANLSANLQAIELRRQIDLRSLAHSGLPIDYAQTPDATGPDFLDAFLSQLTQLLG